ncbi:hypothetical protein N826_29840 [Skermanella aerolata KACC 11604]|nr:hypothetical protein N826_29840 [Skermanella aerolata KACC 11604]
MVMMVVSKKIIKASDAAERTYAPANDLQAEAFSGLPSFQPNQALVPGC